MTIQQITFEPTFAGWQKAARAALQHGLAPDEIAWHPYNAEQPALELFQESFAEPSTAQPSPEFRVPKSFLALAQNVACHASEVRWALLYRVLWRLTHGEPKLLEVAMDQDVHLLQEMNGAIRRDVHKMRAFVRFREVSTNGGTWFVAWFEPEHHIVELNAPFFVDRFASMRWSILTPDRCVHWDTRELRFTDGVPKSQAPLGDEVEKLWLTY
jgi:uracil-DNA glycosylase